MGVFGGTRGHKEALVKSRKDSTGVTSTSICWFLQKCMTSADRSPSDQKVSSSSAPTT